MATDRLPAGLTISAIAGTVTVGVMLILWNAQWPVERGPALVVHLSAGFCLLWVLAAALVAPGASASAARAEAQGVFQIAALATGMLAVVSMLYAAVLETLLRTLAARSDAIWTADLWSGGWIDLALLTAAAAIALRRTGDRHLVTALFWLGVFAGLWTSLQVPGFRHVARGTGAQHVEVTRWPLPFMVIAALLLAGFTWARGLVAYRRRVRAWPDRLDDLASPPPPWPGFRFSAGVVAVLVLVVGCIHVVHPATSASAFLAGAAMLSLAARRWDENLADAGLALITLGVVSLLMLGGPTHLSGALYYAESYNRALLGLGVMVWFWHWLAAVWKQQLENGRAWTTAGSLIRPCQRCAYMMGACGVLVAAALAFWPLRRPVVELDNHAWRWFFGLGGHALLALALLSGSRRTGKPTLAWLALFAVTSACGFIVVRVPGSMLSLTWLRYWPLILAAVSAAALMLAALRLRFAGPHPVVEPLFVTGVLIAPMAAIIGVILIEQLQIPPVVPAATLTALAGVYLLAAFFPGPRSFAAIAALCGATGIWRLLQLVYGVGAIPQYYFVGILTGLAAAALGSIYQHRSRGPLLRMLKWAGGALALISAASGVAMSRF